MLDHARIILNARSALEYVLLIAGTAAFMVITVTAFGGGVFCGGHC
jgi:hypothetical protein